MTTTEPSLEIDWERKFQDQVTANMRLSERHKTLMASITSERDQAEAERDALRQRVKDLEPVEAKLKEARKDWHDSEIRWAREVDAVKAQKAELSRKIGQGQRKTIEGVIVWLQHSIRNLPELEQELEGNDG